MTSEEQRLEIIKKRLEQAHLMVHTAEDLIGLNDFQSAINRAYYALFYAVSALAVRDGFQTSKHGQLQGWFNKNYVKSGVFDTRMTLILRDVYDLRMDADYGLDMLPNESDLIPMLVEVKLFIAQIEEQIQQI